MPGIPAPRQYVPDTKFCSCVRCVKRDDTVDMKDTTFEEMLTSVPRIVFVPSHVREPVYRIVVAAFRNRFRMTIPFCCGTTCVCCDKRHSGL